MKTLMVLLAFAVSLGCASASHARPSADAYAVTVQLRNAAPCPVEVTLRHDRRTLYTFNLKAGAGEQLLLRVPTFDASRYSVQVRHNGACPFPEYDVARREHVTAGAANVLEIVIGAAPAHSVLRLR